MTSRSSVVVTPLRGNNTAAAGTAGTADKIIQERKKIGRSETMENFTSTLSRVLPGQIQYG